MNHSRLLMVFQRTDLKYMTYFEFNYFFIRFCHQVTKNMSHTHYQCGTKEDLDSQLPFSIGVCLEFLLTKKIHYILDEK